MVEKGTDEKLPGGREELEEAEDGERQLSCCIGKSEERNSGDDAEADEQSEIAAATGAEQGHGLRLSPEQIANGEWRADECFRGQSR